MHDQDNQDNQRPTGCSDCGAWPTTRDHRCPPTTPAELEQLVDDLEARVQSDAPHDIRNLLERSSFGTPEAKRLRGSVTDKDAKRVTARVAELAAECCSHSRSWSQPCDCPCKACRVVAQQSAPPQGSEQPSGKARPAGYVAVTVDCPDCSQPLPLRVTVRRLPVATSTGERVVTVRTTPYQHYCRGGIQ